MYRTYPLDDPVLRWRRFSRAGWRLSWLFTALWFGGLALLFRLAPAPAPAPQAALVRLTWLPAEDAAGIDVRALWTPAAFALSTPAGFSHSLRQGRASLLPPVQTVRPAAAFLARPKPAGKSSLAKPGRIRLAASEPLTGPLVSTSIFPPRVAEKETARLVFPEGWESRLFSGIDLNFGSWTNIAWSARVEMQFDGQGITRSMLMAQSSGNPEVDRRLARSANGWRLLEPSAPRTGVVAWNCPAVAPSAPEAAAPSVAAGKEAP